MEFSTSLLIYWRVLWWSCQSYFLSSRFTVFCCASIKHIMFEYIHRYVGKKKRASLPSLLLTYMYCIRVDDQEKLSSGMHCRVLMISSEEKRRKKEKDNHVSEKVSLATLPSFLFIVIEINKRAWWLIVDTDDRTQILTKQVTLWLLLFDYAHTLFSHTTPKCRAVCAVNSIDYAYFWFCFIRLNILFTHHVELKSTWLWSVIHTNSYLPGYYRQCRCILVGIFIFLKKEKKKGVNQHRLMRKSMVCVCG